MTVGSVEHCTPDELVAYADNELPTGAALDVADHLAQCPSCTDRVTGLQVARESFRQQAGHWRVSDQVVRDIGERVDRAGRASWPAIAAVVAVVGLVLAVAWTVWSHRYDGLHAELEAELIEQHQHFGSLSDPTERLDPNVESLTEWFHDRLDAPFIAPALPGAQLLGGRVLELPRMTVPVVYFEAFATRISVYTFGVIGPKPEEALGPTLPGCQALASGVTRCDWEGPGIAWVAISELAPPILTSLRH